ncbi:MAG: helix-turn-helix domain-containing protein [Lachnospiraceae bacterium]|nr:helix-turn-helix domain-containing protein [Lachnospiraceae bacterium]
MSDGAKLKAILDERHMSVRELARKTGINRTTLYYIVKNDTRIRYDFALRIANELEINVKEICDNIPFSDKMDENEVFPGIPSAFGGVLDGNRVKRYLKYTIFPLMFMYGKDAMPDVDNLLTNFYKLDDSGRSDVVNMIEALLINHTDPERERNVKTIKRW